MGAHTHTHTRVYCPEYNNKKIKKKEQKKKNINYTALSAEMTHKVLYEKLKSRNRRWSDHHRHIKSKVHIQQQRVISSDGFLL